MQKTHPSSRPRAARRFLGGLVAVGGTIVWTHALAGVIRAAAGIGVADLAPASPALTLAAVATALAGTLGFASPRRATAASAAAAVVAAGFVAAWHPAAWVPSLALLPAGMALAATGAWLARRLPSSLDAQPRLRPALAVAWSLLALVALVQVGRLATYMTDADSDWFLSTRHPFYARHECANAYVYGAELSRRGEPNVYDSAHYPGLNREAEPRTEIRGMSPEDPYQYAPQFLLWPRMAIAMTHDYGAIRLAWFGINVTLCLATVLLLSAWVGGRVGTVAGLLSPAVLASFPVLHDFQYGQFHFAAIALGILGLLAFQRGRPASGGLLLAVSILSKLFPAVLLVPLAVQRRWRDLAWTAGAGLALTALALAVVGPAPFVAFFDYHLPRLADGSAFAFGEAWPEVATLVTAGNQGIHGIVHKLEAMGVPGADASLARVAGRVFAVLLLAVGVIVGLRTDRAGRAERAIAWLGLLGLASLASTGAWADYVPLTCVWLLAFLVPLAGGRPGVQVALGVCAVMQVFLLGAVPLGSLSDGSWMLPLSLLGALAMLGTFAWATLARSPAPARIAPPATLRARRLLRSET